MADRVSASADGLDALARRIKSIATTIEQNHGQMIAAVQGASSWNDPQKTKFVNEVAAMGSVITSFREKVDERAQYLNRLAAHIRSAPKG